MITYWQNTPVVPADWLQFGALGLLALVLVGVGIAVFIIVRDVAQVVIARVAETGRFSENLARESLSRTQDIAQQSVSAQVQLADAINKTTGAIAKSTDIISQLQRAILDTSSRHSNEHRETQLLVTRTGQEIRQDVARVEGRLGRGKTSASD